MSKDRKLESYRIYEIVFYLDLLIKTKSYSEAREFYVQPMREQRNQEIRQILRKIQNFPLWISRTNHQDQYRNNCSNLGDLRFKCECPLTKVKLYPRKMVK